MNYPIRIKDRLGPDWTDWYGNLTITPGDNGETLLTGMVVNQAALHGLLRKVRDSRLTLLAVVPLNTDPASELPFHRT